MMQKQSRREIGAMLGSCCASLFFGLSYMFTKNIVGQVSVFSLLSWRFLIGSIALSLCSLLNVIHIDFKSKSPWPLLRMTICMPAAYFLFETYGIQLTSSSESGTIIACIPVATSLAAAIFLKERPSKMQITGVLISTSGIIILVLLKGISPSFSALGYLLLFGAVIVDAFYFIENRRLCQFSAVEKTYFMCLTGAVVFTLCALVEGTIGHDLQTYLTLPFTNPAFGGSVLYLGLGCTTLAFLLSNRSVQILGPTRTSTFSGLSTVVSVFSGVMFLHEPFSLLQGIATALVLVGIYFVNMFYPTAKNTPAKEKSAL